jgi:hypothetical protein
MESESKRRTKDLDSLANLLHKMRKNGFNHPEMSGLPRSQETLYNPGKR